ncbi:MAG: hypothetical protein H7835_18365, partial [Magnetococcus sp. XQGC-1]
MSKEEDSVQATRRQPARRTAEKMRQKEKEKSPAAAILSDMMNAIIEEESSPPPTGEQSAGQALAGIDRPLRVQAVQPVPTSQPEPLPRGM